MEGRTSIRVPSLLNPGLRALFFSLFILISVPGAAQPVFAASATLEWLPPATYTTGAPLVIAGYNVYFGKASGVYGPPLNAGLQIGNSPSYTIDNLGTGTYFFAVTAYDQTGLESGFSNEVSKRVVASPGPVISSIAVSAVTDGTALITWTTDVPATSQLFYGTTAAYGSSIPLDSNLVTRHNQALSGLQAATAYHYSIESTDGGGNPSVSADNLFSTSASTSPISPESSLQPLSVSPPAPAAGGAAGGGCEISKKSSAEAGPTQAADMLALVGVLIGLSLRKGRRLNRGGPPRCGIVVERSRVRR